MNKVPTEFVREALENRANYVQNVYGWNKDHCVYFIDAFIDMLCDKATLRETPNVYIDNFFVNACGGSYDDYRNEGETVNEMLDRVQPIFWSNEKELLIDELLYS